MSLQEQAYAGATRVETARETRPSFATSSSRATTIFIPLLAESGPATGTSSPTSAEPASRPVVSSSMIL